MKNLKCRFRLLGAGATLLLLAGCTGSEKMKFDPLQLANLEPRPVWWQVRTGEITAICQQTTKGRAEVIARTPAGYPVHAVFYGNFDDPPPKTNWSAGSASGKIENFLSHSGGPQTILFTAGIHGAEPEGVAAAVNLISLLETGRDLRGKANDRLLELLQHYRLIILPCVNMDGRAISPDHLRQATFEEFRLASQGAWADGTLIGWRGSKEFFPLPLEKVRHPGGYPNSAGFNIMHDGCPGHLRTREAEAILRLAERYAVDFMLNVHSHEYPPVLFPPAEFNYPQAVERGLRASDLVNNALFQAGFRDQPQDPNRRPAGGVNFNTLIPLASGGLAMTFECNISQSFDQMMESSLLALEVLLESGLTDPFCDRETLIR